jgi:hypothetical protein
MTFFVIQSSFAQEHPLLKDGKLYIDSMFMDNSNRLIYSKVVSFDSLTQSTLIKKTKNWASTAFVNLKEVMVSETEDQLVFNYVTDAFYVKSLGLKSAISWYVRLVVQVKDGKMKISFFDDGNVMMPASQYVSATAARAIKLSDYFKTETTEDNKEVRITKKMHTGGLLALHDGILTTFDNLKKSILSKDDLQNDW